jgi:hypothetical protein
MGNQEERKNMTKKKTLKGLAVGATFALAASGLFAAPAQAASAIELTAQGGKSAYGMISGETFTFTSNGNVDFPAGNAGLLRVEVVNTTGGGSPTGFAINAATLDSLNGTGEGTANSIELAGGGQTAASLGATAADKAVFGLGATTAAQAGAASLGGVSAMTSPFTFSFSATAAADTPQAYAVTVFADVNNNGVKDAGELASTTQTVTFFDVTDVVVNYTLDALIEGGLAVGADVTIAGIALDQLTAAEFGVKYTLGTGAALGTQGDKLDIVAFNTLKTKFESDLTLTFASLGLVKATAVKAQLVHLNAGPALDGSTGAAVGSFATVAVTAATVADLTASVVNSVNSNSTNFKPDTAFTVKAIAEDDTTGLATADPVVGAAVTAKIEVRNVGDSGAETLSATKYIIVNGTKYVTSASLPGTGTVAEVALVSDANGEVSLSIETKGLEGTGTPAQTNSVVVTFTSELVSDTLTLEADDAEFAAVITNSDATSASTVDGTGVRFNFEVRDQYGAIPANVYDARAVWVSSNQGLLAADASTAASSVYIPVNSGAASLTVTDNGTGTGANVYAISVEERAVGGGYVAASDILNAAETNGGQFTINVVANATPGAITATGFTKQTTGANTGKWTMTNVAKALALTTFGAYDSNKVLGTEPTGLTFATEAHQVDGTVTTAATASAAAVAIAGVPVTISGAGLQFVSTDSNGLFIYTVGSATVYSDAAGVWTVDVYSNTAGTQTLTVTTGSVTETLLLNDYADAAATTGSSVVVSMASSTSAGSTVAVVATITDKYGNPVQVTGGTAVAFSYSGPGFTFPSTLPTVTDASGQAKFSIILGSNDTGSGTVTVSYDTDASGDFTSTGDFVVAKSFTIGTAGNVGALASWTKNLNDGTVKMYAKNIVGAGKVQFMLNGKEIAWVNATSAADSKLRTANGASYLVRTIDLVEGQKNVLEILVDGVRSARSAYSY